MPQLGKLRTHGVWFVPALAALLLGLLRIGTPELWRDEIASWGAATRNLGQLFAMLGHVDASNGAYYLVLHFWTLLFGDSVPSLRLPSALAMAGAAAFTALTARKHFRSDTAGVCGGLLLAAVPNISAYAQEARAYAMVTCAVAAGTWCLLRALERPGADRWAWYGLCTALGGALHLVSLSALAGQLVLVAAAALRERRWRLLRQFLASAGPAVLVLVPLMVVGSKQSGRQLDWIAAPTLRSLRYFGPVLFGAPDVWRAFEVLALAALLSPWWRAALGMLTLAVLPVVGVWVVSHGPTSYYLDRYVLFTLPAWAALAGGGVAALSCLPRLLPGAREKAGGTARRWNPAPLSACVAGALVVLVALQGVPEQRRLRYVTAHSETDFRGAAGLIAGDYRAGDGIVTGNYAWMMIGPGVAYYLPSTVRPIPFMIGQTAVQANDLYPVNCPVPAVCIGSETRVWVVTIGTSGNPYEDLPTDQAAALRAVFTLTEVRHVRGLTVSLLVRTHP
ncbi:glycosyltransferase family 39 protein [Kitasatospora sp. McL0602]|uniref:glycosyltransferase family 39 protein n=1 Tax=Kitasatospora sp. McL0602 TaxID=3439530 RepID=UPI003F8BEC00